MPVTITFHVFGLTVTIRINVQKPPLVHSDGFLSLRILDSLA